MVLEQRKDFYSRFLDAVGPYVGMVTVSDDMGSQEGPLMSYNLYREMIKPYHKELYTFMKDIADVKIFLHCCGAISGFLDDFVDEGVDVINPVQVSAKGMDATNLKQKFGDKIVFWGGGCDTQRVLQFGTVDEVEEEVKRRISEFKQGGGFVFAPTTPIQPGTPSENILALYDAANEYRYY